MGESRDKPSHQPSKAITSRSRLSGQTPALRKEP